MNAISKYLFYFLLLLAAPLLISAQDPQALPQSVPEQNQGKRNPQQIFDYINEANSLISTQPEQALKLLEKGLELSLSLNNPRGEGFSYHSLGALNYQTGNFPKALEYYIKAIALFTSTREEKGLYNAYRNLGMAYRANKQYPQSLEAYQQFLQRAKASKDQAAITQTEAIIAQLHQLSGKPQQALSQYNQILVQQQNSQDTMAMYETQDQLGDVYLEIGDTSEALGYYTQNTRNRDLKQQAQAYTKIGNVYGSQKRYGEELSTQRKALKINQESGDVQAANASNLLVADLLIKADSIKEALPYLENSAALISEIRQPEQRKQALEQLSVAYEKIGKYEEALENFRQYATIADSLRQDSARKALKNLKLEQAILDQESRIFLLERERKTSSERIQSLEADNAFQIAETRRQRIITYSLLGGLLLFLLLAFLIWRSNKQKNRANQLLALRSLQSQMNPHFIFNSLNSVNSFIAKNDERSANKFLADFSRLMRNVMDNSRHDFVPLSAEVDLLGRYLKLEHFRFQDKFEYKFEVDPALDAELIQVPPMLIQPYIENAVWHGLRYKEEKGQLTVKLSREGTKSGNYRMLAIIEDNGIGRQRSQELKTSNQLKQHSTGSEPPLPPPPQPWRMKTQHTNHIKNLLKSLNAL